MAAPGMSMKNKSSFFITFLLRFILLPVLTPFISSPSHPAHNHAEAGKVQVHAGQIFAFISVWLLMSGKCVRPSSRPFLSVNRESPFFTDLFRSCLWESCEYRRLQGHISFNSFHSILQVTYIFSFL
ncbi:hypothetical protein XENOCAPTIV_010024 [Xenoophorus captivus]|uniref:Secreted protein n=1 Tax=Xenoophorus captivus TaxID=1517983 RepID=A0ABV0QZT9_9TELE